MPITKKQLLPLNLANYDVYIDDLSPNTSYFRIVRMPAQFTGGRNSFLIAGTQYLVPNSTILIEILDGKGKIIYQSMVPNYVESNARMITVEIYDTTTTGPASIRIVGKARRKIDGTPVPPEWQNRYNIRWTTGIAVDYNLNNTSPIKFLRTPQISVRENRFYNINSASFDTINAEFTASLLPTLAATSQIGYCLHLEGASTFSSDHYSGVITGSLQVGTTGSIVNIRLPITKILNNKIAFSKGKLISSSIHDGILNKIYLQSGSYTTMVDSKILPVTSSALLRYTKLDTSSVNIPISYANIRITNLTTVSGEVYKLKVYSKIATSNGNYKLVGDVFVNTSEILVSSSIRGNIPIGNISLAQNFTSSWYAGKLQPNTTTQKQLYPISGSSTYYDSSITANQFTVSSSNDTLLSSIYANVPIDVSTQKFDGQVSESGYFIGTKLGYVLFNNSEYTLQFDAVYKNTSGSGVNEVILQGNTPKVDIYLIGVGTSRIISNNPLGQKIGEVNITDISNWFEKKQFNFSPAVNISGSIGLRFIVHNGFWNFSNISIKPASDPQFSPDEVQILVPNTEYHNKLLRYKIEYFDINNNSINLSTVSTPTFFTGSAIDMGTLPPSP